MCVCACVKVCALQQIFGCYKEGTDGSRYLRQDPNLAEKKQESLTSNLGMLWQQL